MEAQQELLFQLAEVVLYPKYNHSLTASSEKNSTFQEFKWKKELWKIFSLEENIFYGAELFKGNLEILKTCFSLTFTEIGCLNF